MELSDKETPEFIRPQLVPANSPDLHAVDYSVWWGWCKIHASLMWINWNSNWELSVPSWVTLSLLQSVSYQQLSRLMVNISVPWRLQQIGLTKCFQPGLCPGSQWESLQCSPDTLAGFRTIHGIKKCGQRKRKREEKGGNTTEIDVRL